MSTHPARAEGADDEHIEIDRLLAEMSRESSRLAEQCGVIQWSISAMLDIVDHPDLGAEIHMLQDIDRIQQTLTDLAAILAVTGVQADGPPIGKAEVMSAIRLESLRERLGLSDAAPGDPAGNDAADITWL